MRVGASKTAVTLCNVWNIVGEGGQTGAVVGSGIEHATEALTFPSQVR